MKDASVKPSGQWLPQQSPTESDERRKQVLQGITSSSTLKTPQIASAARIAEARHCHQEHWAERDSFSGPDACSEASSSASKGTASLSRSMLSFVQGMMDRVMPLPRYVSCVLG